MRTKMLLTLALALSACTAPPVAEVDAGAGNDSASPRCVADMECDDGLFCSGVERCLPTSIDADEHGCVAGSAPCPADEVCLEASDSCDDECPDVDGDGHTDAACGGDDCDDADERRYPGNIEVCDAEGLDEDCDPTTLGPDADDDGAIQAGCCNVQPDASLLCGTDCDDGNINVAPGAPEICDGLDNDCSGTLDFPGEDDDGDGFADCVDLPAGLRDCDDTRDTVYPGAPEICDGHDSDCNGVRPPGDDEDGDGYAAIDSTCEAGVPRTDCDDRTAGVSPAWTREVCDGVDNDCDSRIDESCTGHCDPVADARVADRTFIAESVRACVALCASDYDCTRACARRTYEDEVSAQCEVCFEPLEAILATAGDCAGRLDDPDCRSFLCEEDPYVSCTGLPVSGCPLPRCDEAYQRYRRCADGPCADAACERECAAPAEPWCRSCLSSLQTCERSRCRSACVDHGSYGCDACLRTSCLPAYETCIGDTIDPPACTSAEAMALESPTGPGPDICADSCFDSCAPGATACVQACGSMCIDAAASPTAVSNSCRLCYNNPGFCRHTAETGWCATECATPGAACDACVCDACELEFITCSGFASARCGG